MGIELGASIQRDSPKPISDWSVVPGGHLHYYHFIGDVTFRIGDADFSAHWGWVPVFDFAVALRGTIVAVQPGAAEIFEFTENSDLIRFSRSDDLVTVTASYVDATATVSYEELLSAANAFLDEIAQELLRKHPSLGGNTYFTEKVFRAR